MSAPTIEYHSQARLFGDTNRRKRHIGILAFRVFLVAQFFSLTRYFFFSNFGSQWLELLRELSTIAGIGSLILLPFVVYNYGIYARSVGGNLDRGARLWLTYVVLFSGVLTVVGLQFQNYSFNAVAQDIGVYAILVSCVILGSIPEFWEDMFSTFLVLSIAAVIINLLGLQNVRELLEGNFDRRIARDLLAYNTETALGFWSLLLLTVYRWASPTRLIIYGIAFFVIIQQLLFQKRLPVAEALAYIFLLLFVMPPVVQDWRRKAQEQLHTSSRARLVIILGAAFVILLVAAPDIISGQVSGLLERYGEEDLSRVGEAVAMVQYLQGPEYLVGRGFGGFFQYRDEYGRIWGAFLDDVKVIGKRNLHVGALDPMLKGGLILMILFHAGILMVFNIRKSKDWSDYLSQAALWIIIIKTLFSLQGNFILMGSSFDAILFSMCIGWLLRKPDDASKEKKPI